MNINTLVDILKSDHYFTDADKDAFYKRGGIVFGNYATDLLYNPPNLIQKTYTIDNVETKVILIQSRTNIIRLIIRRIAKNMKSIKDYTFNAVITSEMNDLKNTIESECNIKIKTPLEYCLELFGPELGDTGLVRVDYTIIIPDGRFVVVIDTKANAFYIHGITEEWIPLTIENLEQYCANYMEGTPVCRCCR